MKRASKPISELTLAEVEDIAIYVGLGVVLLAEFLSGVLGSVRNIIGTSSAPSYVLGLLALRLVVKKLNILNSNLVGPPIPPRDFNQHIRHLLRNNPRVNRIDILATNSRKFYHAIEDLTFYSDEIRILLYEKTPDLPAISERWRLWQIQGRCSRLSMRTYSYTPTFYGISIDKQEGYFGFFDPQYMANPDENVGHMQISGPYPLSIDSPLTRYILNDIQRWFDITFEQHSISLLEIPPSPAAGSAKPTELLPETTS